MVQPRYVINPINRNRKKVLRSAFTSKFKTSIIKKDLRSEASLNRVLKSGKGFVYNVLWFLLISVCTLICCYQTYDRLSFFLSRPIETRVTLIRNLSVKFPSITLCPTFNNYVPLTRLKIQKQPGLKTADYCKIDTFTLLNDKLNITAIWDLMTVKENFYAGEFSRSKSLSGSLRRDPPLFSIKTDTKTVLGTCITYYYNNLVRFQHDDYKLYFMFSNNLPHCRSEISMFMLHSDDDIVTYKTFFQSKVLKIRTEAVYGLSAKRFRVLNRAEKPCDTNQVVHECEKNCFENTLKNISQCRLPMTTVSEVPLCANENDSLTAHLQLMQLSVDFNYLEKCNCDEICDEILYTDHFKMIEPRNRPLLTFYFDDNVIEEIEEYYSYSFISFMCDFGGNLGLFLGLSVLDVFKLVDFINAHPMTITKFKH